MTVTCWTHLLLFCLCCHYELQPAACKPEWMSSWFPCDVTAYNDSKVLFDCRGRHLHAVPLGITSNATELNLSENFMKNISVHAFSNLLNLTHLDLSWANKNKGTIIDVNAFQNLTKLRTLKLTGNCLSEIPGNLPLSVEKVDLSNNRILLLDNRSLAGLTNMTHLWLSKNCFFWNPCGKSVKIMKDTFVVMRKLQSLNLSFNNLTEVPKGLPQSLIMLNLGSNRIQNIADDFLGLPNLKVLKIDGNCPRCLTAPTPCVPCQNISLGIHPNAFQDLTQLEELNLGGNSLDHLNPSWFERLYSLKHLFLTFNFLLKAITEEATFLKYLPRLERIDLSFNFGHRLYPATLNLSKEFSNLVSLQTFHMEGLVFQRIGPGTLSPLYELKNLSALNLGTNFIIHSDSTLFSKFYNLKMIYLTENRLYPTPEKNPSHSSDGFNQRSDLFISPLIKLYPKDFVYGVSRSLVKEECFNSGRVLSLSSNNLFFISPKQFVGYGNIACLNLSRNGFSAALNGTEFSSLPNLTYLDLSFNKIDLAFNNAFKELNKLEVLDLSHNEHYFKAFGVTANLNFTQNLPALRVLNMSHNDISVLTTKQMYSRSLTELQFSHNFLGTLWKDSLYKKLFINLTNLMILDISHNNLAKIPDDVYKYLPCNLTILRINHNFLTDFTWDKLKLFHQLQFLDLSFNDLSNLTGMSSNVTDTLTFLDLSHNHIFHLANGFFKGARSLSTLSLRNNKLTIINQSTFETTPKSKIETLFLQRNPFQCTCDSLDFILWIENSDFKIPRLTTEVTCDTPANQKDHPLIGFNINQCVNDNEAFLIYILTSSFTIVFMIVATVAHLFYWDASYVLHYMKAKLKGYSSLNSPDSVYDVFVTYDTTDPRVSEWVMRDLRVKLEEEGEMHLPLCLEERDWTPGVPLVDNLTQSIRCSRKTLFVLTEGYVKTGGFKLAMYLAHQRLLDENMDVIVLLMLEPVLQHSHFLRLRRRLCEKSVVEWPRTAAAEPWFWQNLRNVVRVDNKVMYNKTYSKYFTNK
ncbi:LOW QUALITY PROTEIN: toll-like receptor 8 [Cottoperca gobio]|uniref:LOW QUALITY PROTEIN: toll-like receptor 8 n=1 Tax=Cottoperca gobio TaxID=56716 RepID=A0A6J2RZS1_COTGO|nr:LOW QUALITY PROTEIN: toll-like receptor 8 [Cottoperca gobio]